MKSQSVTIQMKATEQYVPVVLLVMLYTVALTFQSVDKINYIQLHWYCHFSSFAHSSFLWHPHTM